MPYQLQHSAYLIVHLTEIEVRLPWKKYDHVCDQSNIVTMHVVHIAMNIFNFGTISFAMKRYKLKADILKTILADSTS